MTMTVKIKQPDGNEIVLQSARIIAERSDPNERHPSKVIIVEPSGDTVECTAGTVYAMNGSGATVSQWFLPG